MKEGLLDYSNGSRDPHSVQAFLFNDMLIVQGVSKRSTLRPKVLSFFPLKSYTLETTGKNRVLILSTS